MNTNASETEIIQAARQGDLDAFNQLIIEYQDLLFRVAVQIMRDDMLAADVVQDACLLAFNKLSTFRDGSFRNWLARIVVNLCYDELRRQRRHPTQALEPDDENTSDQSSAYWLADYSTNPEARLEAIELERTIQDCLEMLPPKHRAILILIDMEDFTYDEAAETLNIPVGTVKSRLARARLQMQNIMLPLGIQPTVRQAVKVSA